MRNIYLSMLAAGVILCGAAGAEAGTRTPRINHRQRHQQRRIYQGVRSGELTRRETLRLEREEEHIQQEKHEAREDGRVTPGERRELERDLNRTSRDIYRAKHNRRERH